MKPAELGWARSPGPDEDIASPPPASHSGAGSAARARGAAPCPGRAAGAALEGRGAGGPARMVPLGDSGMCGTAVLAAVAGWHGGPGD